MKKKLSILFLSMFALPIFAFFGCKDVANFGVTVYSSSEALGTVSGLGTFAEGSEVKLSATPKSNGNFVGWVFQNETLLEDSEVYIIETSEVKSTLTFVANADTQGSYTAIFENKDISQANKMMYIKLDSYRFASDSSLQQEPAGILTDSAHLQPAITTNLVVSHGKSSSTLVDFLAFENITLKDNLLNIVENNNQVLNLDAYSARHIRAQLSGTIEGGLSAITKDFRADLEFKTSKDTSNQGYMTKISYDADGTYEIRFSFKHEDETYHLILTYKKLSSTSAA